MEANEATSLSNSELEDAVGGLTRLTAGYTASGTPIEDTRGRICGNMLNNEVYYWPCKKCGRPTHKGWGLFQCDKCDNWFWMIDDTHYSGTESQLKRESAAN